MIKHFRNFRKTYVEAQLWSCSPALDDPEPNNRKIKFNLVIAKGIVIGIVVKEQETASFSSYL